MGLHACYEAMKGNCAAALDVLESEARVERYLLRFADEPTARLLLAALQEERWEDAFRAAHTLKTLCRGLGLTGLHAACLALTDALRGGQSVDAQLCERMRREYEAVLQAVGRLAGER